MKILILAILIMAISPQLKAQTTIPVKNTLLLEKVTRGPAPYNTHYDVMFRIDTLNTTVWINKYRGRYYSNYPYRVIINKKWYAIYDVRQKSTIPVKTIYLKFSTN